MRRTCIISSILHTYTSQHLAAMSDDETFTEEDTFASEGDHADGDKEDQEGYKRNRGGSNKDASYVWRYACPRTNPEKPIENSAGRPIWRCQLCVDRKALKPQEYLISGGTRNASKHLLNKHKIPIPGAPVRELAKRQIQDITSYIVSTPSVKRRKTTTEAHVVDQNILREIYIQYVAENDLPLSHCESQTLRLLLEYLNPAANDLLPRSHSTIRSEVTLSYETKKIIVQQALRESVSKIHLNIDCWTSPNNLPILGVVGHFVHRTEGLQHLVLTLEELHGLHSGANLSDVLLKVVEDFGFLDNLGYITTDNAGNNDTMITGFSGLLKDKHNINFQPKHCRLRCTGHIINLTVKAFLFGNHPWTKKHIGDYEGPSLEAISEWRKYGATGKLHNIGVFIGGSPQRRQAFREVSQGVNFHKDNMTRWNSWYSEIKWALKPYVRTGIQVFAAEEPELAEDMLSAADWKTLEAIAEFLEPFYDATIATEYADTSIEQVLPTMDFLLHHYETAAEKWNNNPFMKASIETGWEKINKYYKITEESPVYAASIMLNPTWKLAYFDVHWAEHPTWLSRAKKDVRSLWNKQYKSAPAIPSQICMSDLRSIEISSQNNSNNNAKKNSFLAWASQRPIVNTKGDELDQYLQEPRLSTEVCPSPLSWWLETTQQSRFPNLSKMAIDLLSIPAMSADVERLFSSAKLTVTDLRNKLQARTLKELQCLKSWNRSTVIRKKESNEEIDSIVSNLVVKDQ